MPLSGVVNGKKKKLPHAYLLSTLKKLASNSTYNSTATQVSRGIPVGHIINVF
jgi:hypothetical protein